MKANLKSILFFLFLILVLVLFAAVLRDTMSPGEQFTYARLQELFDYGLVDNFSLDNKNYLHIVAYEPERDAEGNIVLIEGETFEYNGFYFQKAQRKVNNGVPVKKEYIYRISREIQLEEIHLKATALKQAGWLENYNYEEPPETSWILTYLPYIILFGAMVFFYIFMLRQTSGKGGRMNNFARAHTKTAANEKNPVK